MSTTKKGCDLIISYRPFWETLNRKGITQYQLIHTHNFSTGTLDALRKRRSITLNTLEDICKLLDCKITDVVEFLPPLTPEEAAKEIALEAALRNRQKTSRKTTQKTSKTAQKEQAEQSVGSSLLPSRE